jgi:hypothetical protein
MLPLNTILSLLGVVITGTLAYLSYKHQSLKSGSEIQEAIEKRLKPRYTIDSPSEAQIIPHIVWPEDELYYQVWHVEVFEQQWGSWKKWLPRGSFQGRTKVVYEFPGIDPPAIEELRNHHLYRQPYVQSIKRESDDPVKIEVMYEGVEPSRISRYVSQLTHLIRDTKFRALNPDVDIQYEIFSLGQDDDESTYARLYDANISEPIVAKDES